MCKCLIYGSNLSRGSPQIDAVCFMFFSHLNLMKSNTIYLGTQSKFVSGKPFHRELPSERLTVKSYVAGLQTLKNILRQPLTR